MKKLLYLGLTALIMLFAFGSANAENAKVKVELTPATWTIGETTAVPQFNVTITQASTEENGDAKEGDLALGTAEGNVAVKVTLTNGEKNTATQVIVAAPVALNTTGLTVAGEWTLTYDLVKGDDLETSFNGVDLDASTSTLTVNPEVVPEDDENAPVLTFTPANTESVDNNTEITVTGNIDGYTMEWGTYASVAAAKSAYYGNVFGAGGYPTITEDEPVLRIFLTNRETLEDYAY